MTLNQIAQAAHANARAKGFWDDCLTGDVLSRGKVIAKVPEKLCLVHSEVSEALEDFREGKMETMVYGHGNVWHCFGGHPVEQIPVRILTCPKCGGKMKPTGFPSELADILIRVLEFGAALGIDMDREVEMKMAYNATRPVKHGGKRV
jgi:hypothetical protein